MKNHLKGGEQYKIEKLDDRPSEEAVYLAFTCLRQGDPDSAHLFFEHAAKRGNLEGMYGTGVMILGRLEDGQYGTDPLTTCEKRGEGLRWLQIAAQLGHLGASEYLKAVETDHPMGAA